jgi:hypothetical protein
MLRRLLDNHGRQAAMSRQQHRGPTVGALLSLRPRLHSLLFLLILVPAVAVAQQPCLKLVFNRYCLGGDVNLLAKRQPPAMRQDQGDRVALIYYEGRDRDYVLAWRGQVYKVLRDHRIASQLHYEDLYRLLREKYGDGKKREKGDTGTRGPGKRGSSRPGTPRTVGQSLCSLFAA